MLFNKLLCTKCKVLRQKDQFVIIDIEKVLWNFQSLQIPED